MTYILFVVGFVVLIKGSDLLIDGASSIAKKMNISNLVIGLTVVAFGTSTPELFVNIFASVDGNTELAIGNILGSNIANILLILGVAAVIYPVSIQKSTLYKEIPFSLLAAVVLGILANDRLLDGSETSEVTRSDGFVLIGFFIIFMYYIMGIAKASATDDANSVKVMSTWKSILLVIFGLAGLAVGGQWIVNGALEIAARFGVSQSLVGLTVVAIGTSLPELATSAMAAYKKNTDIAVGNAVGSNIFNIFWVLGLSAIIKPLPFQPKSNTDVIMTIISSLLLFGLLFLGKRHLLQRWQGVLFLLTYIAYIIFLVWRG
ncbi:calcium/sodium antiporter [Aridibaculum aurantiacum]|uniref:calcium/sodium antiporter n=1 Tax=Aridibaculum aurantiacum TaxID=2810307 RepID=UPI001A972370|nr:calcium/sodium antiporter [Aridibaculum aurantiacum]